MSDPETSLVLPHLRKHPSTRRVNILGDILLESILYEFRKRHKIRTRSAALDVLLNGSNSPSDVATLLNAARECEALLKFYERKLAKYNNDVKWYGRSKCAPPGIILAELASVLKPIHLRLASAISQVVESARKRGEKVLEDAGEKDQVPNPEGA